MTPSFVVAASTACLAFPASASTLSLAAFFSSFVNWLSPSIASFLVSAALSIVPLEASVTLYLAGTFSVLPSSYVTVSSISWKPSVVG